MSAATTTQLRERIEAILADIDGITSVITDIDCPLSDASLPAVLVTVGPATRAQTNRDKLLVTRTFQIGLLVRRVCDDSSSEQRAAVEAAEAIIDVIPDHFATQSRRLALNDRGLAWDLGQMADDGIELRPWLDETYSAVTYRLPVLTERT